jgi:two-component sensor histidine kinase
MGVPAAIRGHSAAVLVDAAAGSPRETATATRPGIRRSLDGWLRRERAGLFFGFRVWIVAALLTALQEASELAILGEKEAFSAFRFFTRFALELPRQSAHSLFAFLPVLAATLFLTRSLPRSGPWRVLGLAVGTLASTGASSFLWNLPPLQTSPDVHDVLVGWLGLLLPCGLFVAIYEAYRRGVLAEERARTLRVQDARLEAELSRARLQLLQAQIEPHFLFNTLAHVELLYRTAPGSAARMLDALIDYLQSSLPSLRRSHAILSDESELLAAYLEIHRIRLGARLSYELSIPPELGAAEIPSMMLLTLVENAIKHGINPLPQGGRIAVHAAQRDDRLEISVDDSGRGLSAGQGGGFGLANLKGRLAALFGGSARFDLRSVPSIGTCARLSLPLSWRAFPERGR